MKKDFKEVLENHPTPWKSIMGDDDDPAVLVDSKGMMFGEPMRNKKLAGLIVHAVNKLKENNAGG